MLPQPNLIETYPAILLIRWSNPKPTFHIGISLLWSGIHYYHIEILARLSNSFTRNSILATILKDKISTQVSPLYSLHIYENLTFLLSGFCNLICNLLQQFSIQHGIILIHHCLGHCVMVLAIHHTDSQSLSTLILIGLGWKDFHRFREILIRTFVPYDS